MGRPLKGSRAQARRLLLAAADPKIGSAMRQMLLAIFCSWLSFQRVPCETPDSRLPTASRRMTIATLQRITFVQPPLGCDGCRPRRRRSDAFRTASIAGDQHSWAVPASRVGSCFHLRLRRLHPGRVAASGEGRGLPHVPVARFFSGPGSDETDPLFSARLVGSRRTKRFPLRAPFVATTLRAVASPSSGSQNPLADHAPRRRLGSPEHLPPLSPEPAG